MRSSKQTIRRLTLAALLFVLPLTIAFLPQRAGVRATEPPDNPQSPDNRREQKPPTHSEKKSRQAVSPGKRTTTVMEARFLEGSRLRLSVRDERIELVTPYGKLEIPVRDIQRIEVGFRIPADVARRIDAAVADLGKAEFESREAASAELWELRDYSYPALEKAAKSSDAETTRRARDLLDRIREEVPEERLVFHPHDVIYTADSKNTGRIVSATIKVHTFQFGEQQLRLSHLRQLRSASYEEESSTDVLPDPGYLSTYLGQVGKVYRFRVTGSVVGAIYGTDVYTLDSTLAMAAVHAGAVKVGETAVVRVRIVGAQQAYPASTRNGVTSNAFGAYSGSYQFLRGRARSD